MYDFFANYGQPNGMIRLTKDEMLSFQKNLHTISLSVETREEVEVAKQKELKIKVKSSPNMNKVRK